MEKIGHVWKVNRFMTKLNSPHNTSLQTHYIEQCKKWTQGSSIQLPQFSPTVMCSHCGSLWNTIDYKVRILKSRKMAKSVKKIAMSVNDNKKRIPKVHATLGHKAKQNEMNKIVIKCSVCTKNTELPANRPKREKIQKIQNIEHSTVLNTQKRKKKKNKDKTAGLILSGTTKLNVETHTKKPTEEIMKKPKSTTNVIIPTPKLKKLNIDRLKDIVNQRGTTSKRKSLHSFLTEL